MRTFLGYCSILHHTLGIAPAYEPVCLYEQFGFHRRCVPDPGRNEVMQLIACAERKPLRHRLNALAVARTDQPRHVERAHLSPCFVTQPIQKRLEPTSELVSPIRCPTNHGRPLHSISRPPMSHRKSDLGIPCPRKICQSSASLRRQLEEFRERHKDTSDDWIKVALVHHHPILLPSFIEAGRGVDAIMNSSSLLSLLREHGF